MGSVADLFSSIGRVAGRAAPALNVLGSDRDNFNQNMQAFDRSYAEMDAQDEKDALAEALSNMDDLTYQKLAEAILPYNPTGAAELSLKGKEKDRLDSDKAATIANVIKFAKANGVQVPDDINGNMDINSLRTLIDAGAKRKTNELDSSATRETNRLRAEAEAKAKQLYWDNYGKYVGGKKDDFNPNKFKAEQSYYDALSAYQVQKRNYDRAKEEMLDKIAKASNDEAQRLKMEFSLFREPVPPHKPTFIKAVGNEPTVADVVSQSKGPVEPAPQANKPTPASAPVLPPSGEDIQNRPAERNVADVIKSPAALPSEGELYAAAMGLPNTPDVNVGGVDIPNPFSNFSKSIQAQKIANLATYLLKEGQATDKRDAAMKAAAILESRK